jgi:PAS domain S-box-containing protein
MDSVLDRAPCGFLSFDDDGSVLAVNATLLEWLGRHEDDVVGGHIDGILPPAGRVFHQTYFFPALRMTGRAEEAFLTLLTSDGAALPFLVSARRVQRNGRAVSDCVLLPMRQRRRHEAELLRAQRAAEAASIAKDKFLSMMSHDLRTPLQAIASTIAILAREAHGPLTAAQREDLERIERAGSDLMHLLTDILDFARASSERMPTHLAPVALTDALDRAEALTASQMHEARLRYRRLAGEPLQVRADPDRLQQILLNLLSNAVKFTPAGGDVTVAWERRDARALIRVSDTGGGVAEDQLERIFEPFVQLGTKAVSRAQPGVGLGLAISRELARAMRGELSAHSRPGQGATFTLTLPLADPSAQ